MKKTLSVLLSLLMVLGSVTAMFTMPVSAATTESTESTVENLPENILKTVSGKAITLKDGITLKVGEYYQLDVTVTTTNTTEKFYPTFKHFYTYAVIPSNIVGVRYKESTPGAVETAYNYSGRKEITADNAVTNANGTYKYTYIFSPSEEVASIAFTGDVTNANLFALKGTDWDNFFWQGYQTVRYMVKEGDNVFQRFYGYRAVGDTTVGATSYSVSSKIGGDYYNLYYEGGNTYKTKYNFRMPNGSPTSVKYAPSIDVYETQLFDYTSAYKAVRTEMNFLNSDICKENFKTEINFPDKTIFGMTADKYIGVKEYKLTYDVNTGKYASNKYYDATTGQVLYANLYNGYSSGAWMTTNYFGRRIPTTGKKVSYLYYTTQDGSTIPASTSTFSSDSSMVGRGYFSDSSSTLKNHIGNWLNAEYSITASGAQTLKEGYEALAKTNNTYQSVYMLNRVLNTQTNEYEWKYNLLRGNNNSLNGARLAPAEQNANVALAFSYIYTGVVYDFDNINPVINIDLPKVQGKDSNGNLKDIHANDNTTEIEVVKVNLGADEIKLNFKYDDSREAYGDFIGWYKGSELISTSKTVTLPYSTYKANNYTAVVEYENYLGNVGGFEACEDGKKLVPELETITFGEGDSAETRTQYSQAPTGQYWGQYEWGATFRLPSGYEYDANVAEFIGEYGALSSPTDSKGIFAKTSFNKNGITAMPYSGKKMGYMNSGVYVAVKAIENLTPGKSYTVSFYTAYCRTDTQGLAAAAVCDTPLDFYCYYNWTLGDGKNREVQQILGYKFTNGKLAVPTGSSAVWEKVTLYFTATDETEYLFFRTPNSQTVVDDFVCKEFNEVNNTENSWDFENDDADALYNRSHYNYGIASKYETVSNRTGDSKFGSSYLKVTANSKDDNGVSVNFNYNGKDRYVLSFDMKVNSYAAYVEEQENKIEIFASKMANMGYNVTDCTEDNALNVNTTLTRTWQSGKTYNKVLSASEIGGLYTFKTQGENLKFSTEDGAAIWNGWQHFEMEINPTDDSYSGAATLGITAVGAGWEIHLDNIKVEKYSADDIAEIKDATNGTYAYNIRSQSAEGGQGLRFKSSIDLDVLDNFGTGSKVVEYGTLVADSSKLGDANLTRAAAIDKAMNGFIHVGVAYNRADGTNVQYSLDTATNVLTYTGVLTGFAKEQYNTVWSVRSYVVVENANGVKTVVYGDVCTISLVTAAQNIINTSSNADDIAAAQEVIDALN